MEHLMTPILWIVGVIGILLGLRSLLKDSETETRAPKLSREVDRKFDKYLEKRVKEKKRIAKMSKEEFDAWKKEYIKKYPNSALAGTNPYIDSNGSGEGDGDGNNAS